MFVHQPSRSSLERRKYHVNKEVDTPQSTQIIPCRIRSCDQRATSAGIKDIRKKISLPKLSKQQNLPSIYRVCHHTTGVCNLHCTGRDCDFGTWAKLTGIILIEHEKTLKDEKLMQKNYNSDTILTWHQRNGGNLPSFHWILELKHCHLRHTWSRVQAPAEWTCPSPLPLWQVWVENLYIHT